MAGKNWSTLPFSEAVWVNPPVPLKRGSIYPFVDMQSVDSNARSVYSSQNREFTGGGSRFKTGDTLMARITPCLENGKIARFAAASEDTLGHGSTEFIVIRGKPGISTTDFAFYLTKWDEVHGYAVSQMTGTSGRQRVPTESLSHLKVQLPPLPEQQAIAHILGTLDDKIELNRRMNETLEAMARAIFKSWFVDFDPVKAKAAGKKPAGMSDEIAALFPDSFQDSELGEIPKGWKAVSLSDAIEILGGGTPKTSNPDYWDGIIPWFSVVDAPSDTEVWVVDTEKMITQAGLKNSSTQVLPVGTTIITARGTVGRLALVGVPMAMNQSCYGLRSRDGEQGFFGYFTIRGLISNLQRQTHGSVFDTITRDTLNGVDIVNPEGSVVRAFENRIAPLMERIRQNIFESRTLATIRDALLPKLISGEIRLKNAEKLLEVV